MPPKKKCGGKRKCKQVGGWFWEDNDPITGGIVRGVKKVLQVVKPSQIADFAGNFYAPARTAANGLRMVGLGRGRNQGRQHGRGDGFLVPNSSSYGGIKF